MIRGLRKSLCTSTKRILPLKVQDGDFVKLKMKGYLEDGVALDTADFPDEFTFPHVQMVVGQNNRGYNLPVLSDFIRGMEVNQVKEEEIDVGTEIFGDPSADLVQSIPLSSIPSEIRDIFELGKYVENHMLSGKLKVTHIDENKVVLDSNFEFAGVKSTIQRLKVLEIIPKSELNFTPVEAGNKMFYPSIGDKVTIHYDASLQSTGQLFDSSRVSGVALSFVVGADEVIPGLEQAVLQMSEGERSLIKMPSGLGYGPQGHGSIVPPHSDLLFDIEIVRIERGRIR